ncbi:MAG: nucleoside deaminase [Candidatus Hydrogenedentes bacterium]|nr:nucleoside deaminase [Candidatus Hydrogenedentota bacterium]
MPPWLSAMAAAYAPGGAPEARMAFVIEAARRNVSERTGGPFAAAVFEQESGRLVALGVNLVTTQGASILHAEIVALALAQRAAGNYDLGAPGLPAHELVTSTEPCAMCLGAIPWSGVRRVVCGARDEDARAAGFDEGAKPADWAGALAARGIAVLRDVARAEAAGVLREYADGGGPIYNSRAGTGA